MNEFMARRANREDGCTGRLCARIRPKGAWFSSTLRLWRSGTPSLRSAHHLPPSPKATADVSRCVGVAVPSSRRVPLFFPSQYRKMGVLELRRGQTFKLKVTWLYALF